MKKLLNKNRVLVVGDTHMKDRLGYADYIEDGREAEKEEILSFIIDQASDCGSVVFLGDIFNQKNNPSKVNARVSKLLTDLGDREIYVLAGNHDTSGDNRTSIDFLKEMNMPNWHIITAGIYTDGEMTFCPYFNKPALGYNTYEEGSALLQKMLKPNKALFVHHTITESMVASGLTTNLFPEISLDREQLIKKYKFVYGGHIHRKQTLPGGIIVAGSVFSNEAGEQEKSIFKLDLETGEQKEIPLPGRRIYILKNPDIKDLALMPKHNIVKVIMDDPKLKSKTEELKIALETGFDAYVFLEQYPNERKKVHFEGGMLEFTTEKLLEAYATERDIPLDKLINGYNLIK